MGQTTPRASQGRRRPRRTRRCQGFAARAATVDRVASNRADLTCPARCGFSTRSAVTMVRRVYRLGGTHSDEAARSTRAGSTDAAARSSRRSWSALIIRRRARRKLLKEPGGSVCIDDADFGPLFIKVCSYAPWSWASGIQPGFIPGSSFHATRRPRPRDSSVSSPNISARSPAPARRRDKPASSRP